MINFQFNLASISGIVLAVGGAALYAVRATRPQLSRDHDIFFSAIGLLCGLILIFYGWRFDPIMQFGQVLLTGAAIFFVVENLRLRQVSTEQAKRNTPIVDSDRPVSREYRADFDEYDSFDAGDRRPKIPGSRSGNARRDDLREDFGDRRRSARVSDPQLDTASRPRPKRRSQIEDPYEGADDWAEQPARNRESNRSADSSSLARPRNRPSSGASPRSRQDESSDYVDYRPIEDSETGKGSWES